ncbi:hypothetical protein T484DRAFT_1917464, partial [Baffinella frigidus]
RGGRCSLPDALRRRARAPFAAVSLLRYRGTSLIRKRTPPRTVRGSRGGPDRPEAGLLATHWGDSDPLGPLGFNFSQHTPTTRRSVEGICRESIFAFEGGARWEVRGAWGKRSEGGHT